MSLCLNRQVAPSEKGRRTVLEKVSWSVSKKWRLDLVLRNQQLVCATEEFGKAIGWEELRVFVIIKVIQQNDHRNWWATFRELCFQELDEAVGTPFNVGQAFPTKPTGRYEKLKCVAVCVLDIILPRVLCYSVTNECHNTRVFTNTVYSGRKLEQLQHWGWETEQNWLLGRRAVLFIHYC